jgi:hypothetical protein
MLLAGCAPDEEPSADPTGDGPYVTAFVTITTTNPATDSELVADLHFPTDAAVSVGPVAPVPVLVFVPGTSTPRGSYSGNARQLATWGYVVALPGMPENDVEVRASDIAHLLAYLGDLNVDRDSDLFRRLDLTRIALTGHSLGGIAPLMIAARGDTPVLAVVPLDPVNPTGNAWDYEGEGWRIDAPVAIIGAASHPCNWFAGYREMYGHLGGGHKAMFEIQEAGHCDFLDPGMRLASSLCGLICGGYSEQRLALIERYATAWHNYYVRLDTDSYDLLYGAQADSDVAAGLVERTVDTAPRDVRATGVASAVELSWRAFDHPVVTGYHIYRSQQSQVYHGPPYAQVGPQSGFVDVDVVPGTLYYYVVACHDAAGNEHQLSIEVSAVPRPATAGLPPRLPALPAAHRSVRLWDTTEAAVPAGG